MTRCLGFASKLPSGQGGAWRTEDVASWGGHVGAGCLFSGYYRDVVVFSIFRTVEPSPLSKTLFFYVLETCHAPELGCLDQPPTDHLSCLSPGWGRSHLSWDIKRPQGSTRASSCPACLSESTVQETRAFPAPSGLVGQSPAPKSSWL